MNKRVDPFFHNASMWKSEMAALRNIVGNANLEEELKWKQPCYTYQGKNVAIIGAFKKHCILSFFKGVLLKDPKCLLMFPGENSQSVKYLSFTSVREIMDLEPIIKEYIKEAIEIEKSGKKIEFSPPTKLELPKELVQKMKDFPLLEKAYEALTPGRQRAYLIYFNGAKQSKTREDRIEKYTERILNGKGINDCVCGLSKRLPNCDGSHKNIHVNQ